MEHKKDRTGGQSDGMMVFGIHPVLEAIESGKEIDRVFLQRNISGPAANSLRQLMRDRGIRPVEVPIEKLNRLTRSNHQGVVAFITEVNYHALADVVPNLFESGRVPLILMLD
ncbi:MAG: RNA methyltransferase substrate-binding domain-containing protein, partial [Bacteroidota bacterium]